MSRIIIFGNSGSGKTTLASKIKNKLNIPHLDLDTLAWQEKVPPERKSSEDSKQSIDDFLLNNKHWVIEGCYADLIEMVTDKATQLIYLNPEQDICISNCKSRPWEPHKYRSLEEQNKNLDMLIDWVKQYEHRVDVFSKHAHQMIFESFSADKKELKSNEASSSYLASIS